MFEETFGKGATRLEIPGVDDERWSCRRRTTGQESKEKKLPKQHSISGCDSKSLKAKGTHSYGPSDRSTFGGVPTEGSLHGPFLDDRGYSARVQAQGVTCKLPGPLRQGSRNLQLPMVQAQLAPVCVREKSSRPWRFM